MTSNRLENSIRNITYEFINFFVNQLFPFGVRTVILYKIGVDYLGMNSLFTSILGVLNIAELGFNTAINYSLYKPLAEKNIELICQLINFYKKIYRLIGSIILIIGVVVGFNINMFATTGWPDAVNYGLVYFIFLLDSVLSYFMYAHKKALLIADQQKARLSQIDLICNMTKYFLQVLVVFLFQSYYCYILLMPLFTITENIWVNRKTKALFPQYICAGVLPQNELAVIKKNVLALFGYKIATVFTSSVDTIVVSVFLGLTEVAIFNNYYYVVNAVMCIIQAIDTGLVASIGNSIAIESVEKNKKDYFFLDFIMSMVVGWCSICIFCLIQDFMLLWVGTDNMYNICTALLFAVEFYVWKIEDITLIYKEAAGMWWQDKFRPHAMCVINLFFNIILVKSFGINGVIISTIISMAVVGRPWIVRIFYKQYLNEKSIKYWSRHIKYAMTTCLFGAITFFFCGFVTQNGIVAFFFKGLICLLVPGNLYMIILCCSKWRIQFKDLIFNILRRE